MVGSGILSLYFGNMETVPYSKRSHLVLMLKAVERVIGEAVFEKQKVKLKGNILSARDSKSITVQMIGYDIIHALRKKSREQGWQHLEGLNWEILVVDSPTVRAISYPGGKIFVSTGLLEHFRSNAEIATILGHEVFL